MNTIYVYGNGEFILDVLTSVNFFMHNAMSFFKVSAILSLLVFAVQSTGVLPTRGYDWSRFIRSYLLIAVFVLTPYPKDVIVHDVITNQDRTFSYSDSKLPFGLIAPIAITSTIMYNLIQLYQQNLEIDKNLNYTYSGMNFGANFILGLDNADSYDDRFNMNLSRYMQHCAFPVLNKKGKLSELKESKDIFATLIQYAPRARYVQQINASDSVEVVSCYQAINEINNYYEANKEKILSKNASMMGFPSTAGFDRFLNSANATAETLLQISQGASAALKQAIGMNMIMASLKAGAQTTGNGSLALAAYDTEQFQQYKTTSALSGAASARTIPILVAIAFALLFLLYPIMIFLAIVMGSYRAIGVFLQIIVAINLIPLIYEILNYITTYYLQKKLGIIIVGQGYSYDISTSLYSFTDNMIIAGNYLATATPLIAYSIVTGSSFALTTVFSHINDPAKQSASALGQEYARGNQTMGNTSIDTHSFNTLQGNKLDNQFSMNSGVPVIKDTTSGGIRTNYGGQNFDYSHRDDLLTVPNVAKTASTTLSNMLQQNYQELNNHQKQWSANTSRIKDCVNELGSGSNTSSNISAEDRTNLTKMQSSSNSIDAVLKAHASVGVGIGKNSIGAEGSIGKTWSAREVDDLNHTIAEYKNYVSAIRHSSNQSLRDAFSDGNSFADSTSHLVQDTVNKERHLLDALTTQSSVTTNYSPEFASYLRDQGLDPRNMKPTDLHTYGEKFARKDLHDKYGIKSELDAPSNHILSNPPSNPIPTSVGLKGVDTAPLSNNPSVAVHDAITAKQNELGEGNPSPVVQQVKKIIDKAPSYVKDGVIGKSGYPEYSKK